MKRIAFLLVLVSACKTVTVVAPAAGAGAATPKAAVERFVLAAKMQDVQREWRIKDMLARGSGREAGDELPEKHLASNAYPSQAKSLQKVGP